MFFWEIRARYKMHTKEGKTLRVVGQMPRRLAASLSPTPNWLCRSSSRSRFPGLPGLPAPFPFLRAAQSNHTKQVSQRIHCSAWHWSSDAARVTVQFSLYGSARISTHCPRPQSF